MSTKQEQILHSSGGESGAMEEMEALRGKFASLSEDKRLLAGIRTRMSEAQEESIAPNLEGFKAELEQLGVETPENPSIQDLEKALEERVTATDEELRAFLLEHPDVEPEQAEALKREFVAADLSRLKDPHRRYSDKGAFYVPQGSYDFETAYYEQGKDDVAAGLEAGIKAVRKDNLWREFPDRLGKAFPDPSKIDAFTKVAISRSLILGLIGPLLAENVERPQEKAAAIEAMLERHFQQRGLGEIPADMYTSPENGGRVISEERATAYYLDTYQNNPGVTEAAETIAALYEKLSLHERLLPEQIRELSRRQDDIQSELDDPRNWVPQQTQETAVLDRFNRKSLETLTSLIRVRARLDQTALGLSVRIFDDGRVAAGIPEIEESGRRLEGPPDPALKKSANSVDEALNQGEFRHYIQNFAPGDLGGTVQEFLAQLQDTIKAEIAKNEANIAKAQESESGGPSDRRSALESELKTISNNLAEAERTRALIGEELRAAGFRDIRE